MKKNKKVIKKQKKITKKVIVKSVKKQKIVRGAMAIVPYSEIVKPEMYKGKFTLAPTPLTENQIKAIIAPTPKHIIKTRPGKGGGSWDYVPGWWFKKKANFVFGFSHDFEVDGERVDGDFITVKGKVTVREPKTGRVIAIKGDFGGAGIKYHKDKPHTPANYLDISNDFKAAATDCFKRCMVQFGFAMDVYGKSESIEAGIVVRNDEAIKTEPIKNVEMEKELEQALEFECFHCANPLTKAESEFSKKMFGRQLCRDCQKLAKEGAIKLK